MYPLTSRPEASSTCERVGALAAWASASVGAANAAETADAMRSFFIERPFVGWENASAAFYFGFKPARLLDAGSPPGLRPKRPPPTCLIPTNVYLVSLVPHSSRMLKIAGAATPEIRARIDQKRIFSNSPIAAAPWGRRAGLL